MPDYFIRKGTVADARRLARLRWDFTPAEHAGRQPFDEFARDFEQFLAAALRDGRWTVWVAEAEGRVVGNLYLLLRAACPPELKVVLAPFAVVLADDTEVQPDLLGVVEYDQPAFPVLQSPE